MKILYILVLTILDRREEDKKIQGWGARMTSLHCCFGRLGGVRMQMLRAHIHLGMQLVAMEKWMVINHVFTVGTLF
jgi:hypothetical protein